METDFEYLVDTLHSTLWDLDAFQRLMGRNDPESPEGQIAMVLSPLLRTATDNLTQVSEALETFAGGRLIIKTDPLGNCVAERQEPKTA